MTLKDRTLTLSLPAWLDEAVAAIPGPLEGDEARMAFAVELSRKNVEHGGGPFAALVFSGSELVAAGVNRVLETGFSIAHAEILALMNAQERRPELGSGRAEQTLVASTEPCCQCFGALVWAGVTRLVCGATTSDAEDAGFDEGPKPPAWARVLEERGISVLQGVRREEARGVLAEYRRRGGPIYGPTGR